MTDALILAIILAAILTLMGYKMQSRPVNIIAGFGWVIAALLIYQELGELLDLGLMVMIGITQVFLVDD